MGRLMELPEHDVLIFGDQGVLSTLNAPSLAHCLGASPLRSSSMIV